MTMEVDVKNLKPPSEEEIRRVERMAEEDDDGFPGQGGIVAHRMRLRHEETERRRRFEDPRLGLRKGSLPRMAA
jgi:hypothetical protein